ncbi:MAG: hypothetical protein H0V41_00365, partial [Pseudonocardiales bacterium]|nr:hypothetical protein [Pseudonocardiales bacterium]
SRSTGGTGLGLAIVKHVAANHGGAVALWSKPATGSTFTLRIPAHPDSRQAARTNGHAYPTVSLTDAVRGPAPGAEIIGSGLCAVWS